jgi:hypothetical protein
MGCNGTFGGKPTPKASDIHELKGKIFGARFLKAVLTAQVELATAS